MTNTKLPNKWISIGVTLCLIAAMATCLGAILGIQRVLSERDAVLVDDLNEIIALQKIMTSTEHRIASYRGYFLTGDESFLENYRKTEMHFSGLVQKLQPSIDTQYERELLKHLLTAEEEHRRAVEDGIRLKKMGASQTEIIKYFEDTISPIRTDYSQTLQKLETYSEDELYRSKEETIARTRHSLFIILLASTLGLLLLFTILYRLNAKVNRQAIELSKANTSLEEFSAIASHDLKSPLYNISLFLQLLDRKYSEKLDADAREYIAHSVQGADRMIKLIERLLTYARAPHQTLKFQKTNLHTVIEDSLANLKMTIQECNATIDYAHLPTIEVDRIQMLELFQNLIANGIKYQPPGAQPKIIIEAKKTGDMWRFSVQDNGIGIDPAQTALIFEPFKRLGQYPEVQGTGLGLSVCSRIVQRHGGTIWVESKPHEGSCFYFTLPEAQPKTQREKPYRFFQFPFSKLRTYSRKFSRESMVS